MNARAPPPQTTMDLSIDPRCAAVRFDRLLSPADLDRVIRASEDLN